MTDHSTFPESPAGEAEETHRIWLGQRSDARFEATVEDGIHILGVRAESETPLLIRSAFSDPDILQSHAEYFDLALSVARGEDAPSDEEVRASAMALVAVRDTFFGAGTNLSDALKARRTRVGIDPATRRALESSNRGARALLRIAARIDARLVDVLPAARLALLRIDEETAPRN